MIAPTWNRVLTEPEERRVEGLLQQPPDHVMDDIDLLAAELNPTIPMRVFKQSLPAYLATGRPLSMLDQKFSGRHPIDRLKKQALIAPEFRELVQSGLEAGLVNIELRRAEALAHDDSGVANGLAAIGKLVMNELALLDAQASSQFEFGIK